MPTLLLTLFRPPFHPYARPQRGPALPCPFFRPIVLRSISCRNRAGRGCQNRGRSEWSCIAYRCCALDPQDGGWKGGRGLGGKSLPPFATPPRLLDVALTDTKVRYTANADPAYRQWIMLVASPVHVVSMVLSGYCRASVLRVFRR